MHIFKTRHFAKWARKEKLKDQQLAQAIDEMENGLIGADLGGHAYKKRIALTGRGKRDGARTIIVYKAAEKAFFIFGYAKNERANISSEEKQLAKTLANELLDYSATQLTILIEAGKLIEVNHEE